MSVSVIKKRDGRIAPFDIQKITDAINRSFRAGDPNRDFEDLSTSLALEVYSILDLEGDPAPDVEHVQLIVEQVLLKEGYAQVAKDYILFRQERTRIREMNAKDGGINVPFHDRETAFCWLYRQHLRLSVELQTDRVISDDTLAYYTKTLFGRGYTLCPEPDSEYFAREADLLCGTFGFERDTVEKAQRISLKYATQAAELLRCIIQVP